MLHASKILLFFIKKKYLLASNIKNCIFFKGFGDKRCFLPHVNTKISTECPANYTFNPDNEYYKIRYKELTKGSYTPVKGLEEVDNEPTQESSADNSNADNNGKKTSKSGTKTDKEEAVQLYPQEITLKLRISNYFV